MQIVASLLETTDTWTLLFLTMSDNNTTQHNRTQQNTWPKLSKNHRIVSKEERERETHTHMNNQSLSKWSLFTRRTVNRFLLIPYQYLVALLSLRSSIFIAHSFKRLLLRNFFVFLQLKVFDYSSQSKCVTTMLPLLSLTMVLVCVRQGLLETMLREPSFHPSLEDQDIRLVDVFFLRCHTHLSYRSFLSSILLLMTHHQLNDFFDHFRELW